MSIIPDMAWSYRMSSFRLVWLPLGGFRGNLLLKRRVAVNHSDACRDLARVSRIIQVASSAVGPWDSSRKETTQNGSPLSIAPNVARSDWSARTSSPTSPAQAPSSVCISVTTSHDAHICYGPSSVLSIIRIVTSHHDQVKWEAFIYYLMTMIFGMATVRLVDELRCTRRMVQNCGR